MIKVDFTSAYLTSDWILSRVSDLEIFSYYMGGDFRVGRAYCSPLRYEKKPSFAVYQTDNGLRFKDFGSDYQGNCFRFVMELYGISYYESIRKVAEDFNLTTKTGLKMDIPIKHKIEKKPKPRLFFKLDLRPFKPSDLAYWASYGVSHQTLVKYDVMACRRALLMEGTRLKSAIFETKGNPTYSYKFDTRYKIYKPFDKNFKWLSNTTALDIQGYKQLPDSGELLIITKGMKDILCLRDLGYLAIAPQTEVSFIPLSLIDSLKIRFARIIIWYDEDKCGTEASTRISKEYGLMAISTGTEEQKDVSDYFKKYGKEKTQELITNLINDKPGNNPASIPIKQTSV